MLELVKKDNLLYAKVLMNLRLPINYQNRVYGKGEKEELLLPEEVMHILAKNGNILFWNGNKYIKLNLGQFYDVVQNKKYRVKDFVEPKKEVIQQPKKEEPVVQPKVEEKPEAAEQPKVEEEKVVAEQPKKEHQQPKQQNENKKQRHNNNNNNNKQNNQGGDK